MLKNILLLIVFLYKLEALQNNVHSNNEILYETFDHLMDMFNYSHSEQIRSCFSQMNTNNRNKILYQFIENGYKAGSNQLQRFPVVLWKKSLVYTSQQTLNCFINSNDLILLLSHHNTSTKSLVAQFSKYTKTNFLSVHYYFSNMSNLIQNFSQNQVQQIEVSNRSQQLSQQLAKLISSLCYEVFNSRKISVDNPWLLTAQNVEKMDQYYGISVSNGVIGAVSSKKPFELSSTVLAGAYDKQGRGRVDNLIQTFPALHAQLSFNGISNYYNYKQQLNMREGSMSHQFSSEQYSVNYQTYALKNLPFVFLTQIQFSAHKDGTLVIKNIQQAPNNLKVINKNFEQIDSNQIYSILQSEAMTKTENTKLAIASSFLHTDNLDLDFIHEDWDMNMHLLKFKKILKKGQTLKFGIVNCLISSQHHEDPMNQAIRMIIRAIAIQNNIIIPHFTAWNSLWESDIIIQGNSVDQKFVRSLIYHMYSFVNQKKSYGISPMGLSGLGYNGHIFWDMDIWIYPALLILKPQMAKTLIEYRIQRLQQAKNNAFINGYKGAMYPWESSKSGAQQTPIWALTGPLQHHISGCVAFGVWNYYRVTQNKEWLSQKGYDVLISVAEFFESRVQQDKNGFYHINNVVGSDEWAQNVNDDAFTNGVAKISFDIANQASKVLNISQNKKWKEISDRITILKFQDNVTKQHETYTGEDIKQADANLLSFPLKIIEQKQSILKDLHFYQTRIPDIGTPAMTYSIFALLYSRLQDPTNAYKYFKQSYEQFVKPPFNVFSETKGGNNPYFMTGAGGVLQSLIFGFGGIDITNDGLQKIKTSIPRQWNKIQITRMNNLESKYEDI